MKRLLLQLLAVFVAKCLLIPLINEIQAQKVYSDLELVTIGKGYYEKGDYRNAEVYLFAFIQRNPASYQTNSTFRSQVNVALQDSRSRATTAGSDGKMDDPNKPKAPNPAKPNKTVINISEGQNNVAVSTGKYVCDDGGTYYIRVVANEIWWIGLSRDSSWSNVLHGTISGNMINAKWSDVPMKQATSSGVITLKIENSRTLKAINKTGGFGGSTWQAQIGPMTKQFSAAN